MTKLMATKAPVSLENPYSYVGSPWPHRVIMLIGLFTGGLAVGSLLTNPSSIITWAMVPVVAVELTVGVRGVVNRLRRISARDAWEEGHHIGVVESHGSPFRPPTAMITMPPHATMNDLRRMMGMIDAEEEEAPRKRPPKHDPHGPTEVDLECAGCRHAIAEVLK